MDMIADRVIATRAATWEDQDEQGRALNRTMAIANLGGATLDNEENEPMISTQGQILLEGGGAAPRPPTTCPSGRGATSPSWAGSSTSSSTSATSASTWSPTPTRASQWASGALGMPLATYMAALVANTSMPVWRRARFHLPFLFAASAASAAGAAGSLAAITTPARESARPGRWPRAAPWRRPAPPG